MSTRQTITIASRSFAVRSEVLELIKGKEGESWNTIQDLVCWLFDEAGDLYSDEYALAVFVWFPESTAVEAEKRRGRALADARKYSRGKFACQEQEPDREVRILDAGSRTKARSDDEHAAQVFQMLS